MSEGLTYRLRSCNSHDLLNQTLIMLTFVSAILLTACSEDSLQDDKKLITLEAVPCAQTFVNVEPMSFTRAWTMPPGYLSYDQLNSMFVNQAVFNKIDIFFTQYDNSAQTPNTQKAAVFTKGSDDRWRTNLTEDEIHAGATYYLYGYAPDISSVKASVSPLNNDFSQGAVLTLSDLPTVTSSDVCVVVGVKNGKDSYRENENYTVAGLAEGDFSYVAGGNGENYVFLLFDHIYSAMHFRFRVASDYANLRTIKLKKLELLAYDNTSSSMVMTRDLDVSVTLRANNTGASPIVGDVSFTPSATSDEMNPEPIYENDNPVEALPSGYDNQGTPIYANFFGGFIPKAISSFTLVSTYDVYDTKGNLIRLNSTARNTFKISELFSRQDETQRGWKYTVDLTIQPTFLYVLSEPDLDSPEAVLN